MKILRGRFLEMAITKAVAEKRWQQVRLLTELYYDVNLGDYRGYTPLIQCVYIDDERKAIGVARYLLKHGAKVDINDKLGLNALMHACKIDRERLALLFLNEKDFNLNHSDRHGNTALIYTAITGNILILNKMLAEMKKYKISIDKANHDGITPLIAAAKHGNILCTRILISVGRASVGIRDNKYHRTAKEWESTRNSRDLAAKSPLFQFISASSQNSSSSHSASSSISQSTALPSSSLATSRRPRSAIPHSQQSRSASANIAIGHSTPHIAKKQTRAISAGPFRRRLPSQQSVDRPSLSTPITPFHRQQSGINKENDSKRVVLTPFNKLMLIYQAQCTPSYKVGVKSINEDKYSSGRSVSPASTIERENSETVSELSGITSVSKRRMSLSRLVGLTRSRRDSTSSNTSTSSFSKLAKKALAATRSESSSKASTNSSPDDGDSDRPKSDHSNNTLQRFRSFSDIRHDQEKSEDDKAKIRSRFTVKFQLPQNKNLDRSNSTNQTIEDDRGSPTDRPIQPLENSRHRILAATKLVSLYKETKNKSGRDRKNQPTHSSPTPPSDTVSDQIKGSSPISDQIKDSPPMPHQQELNPVKSDDDDLIQSNTDQETNNESQDTADDDEPDQEQKVAIKFSPQFTYDTIGAINKFSKQFQVIKDQSKIKFPTVIEVEEE